MAAYLNGDSSKANCFEVLELGSTTSRSSSPSNESIIFTPQSSAPASPLQDTTVTISLPPAEDLNSTHLTTSFEDFVTDAFSLRNEPRELFATASESTDFGENGTNLHYQPGSFDQQTRLPYESAKREDLNAAQDLPNLRSECMTENGELRSQVNEYLSDLKSLSEDAGRFVLDYPHQIGYRDFITIIKQEIEKIRAIDTSDRDGNAAMSRFRGMHKHYVQQLSIQKDASTRNVPGPTVLTYRLGQCNGIHLAHLLRDTRDVGQKLTVDMTNGGNAKATKHQGSQLTLLDQDLLMKQYAANREMIDQLQNAEIRKSLLVLVDLRDEARRLKDFYPYSRSRYGHIIRDLTSIINLRLETSEGETPLQNRLIVKDLQDSEDHFCSMLQISAVKSESASLNLNKRRHSSLRGLPDSGVSTKIDSGNSPNGSHETKSERTKKLNESQLKKDLWENTGNCNGFGEFGVPAEGLTAMARHITVEVEDTIEKKSHNTITTSSPNSAEATRTDNEVRSRDSPVVLDSDMAPPYQMRDSMNEIPEVLAIRMSSDSECSK